MCVVCVVLELVCGVLCAVCCGVRVCLWVGYDEESDVSVWCRSRCQATRLRALLKQNSALTQRLKSMRCVVQVCCSVCVVCGVCGEHFAPTRQSKYCIAHVHVRLCLSVGVGVV